MLAVIMEVKIMEVKIILLVMVEVSLERSVRSALNTQVKRVANGDTPEKSLF
jgi:hypothetical protein